jgi:hypothetical protein
MRPIFLFLSIACFYSSAVLACATCLCGDPTITTMGTEKAFAGRIRVGVEYLAREEIVGRKDVSEHKVFEERLTYNVSYAITDDWVLAASIPTVDKKVERYDTSKESSSGLGDTDITARWTIGGDDKMPVRNLWGMQLGVRLPTSSEEKFNGVPIDFDAQVGAGTTIPNIGVWYGRYEMPWFFYTSATYQHAVNEGYQGYDMGDVLLVTGHMQYALMKQLALQFSLDSRIKAKDHYNDIVDDDSGGFLMMASPGIAWTPFTDFIVNVNYQMPLIESPNGYQEEKPVARVGVVYDF